MCLDDVVRLGAASENLDRTLQSVPQALHRIARRSCWYLQLAPEG